ncbi:AMP-binding protein [Billgrantia sulfidoxydans]|uniref:acetate--CoA ligase n=1 Tax=Billgrantia sulfidoxydans TaxID=2733484 RepID=A0ABX7W9Z4_9GAMM|nr:AMP-binding protein [Halomonas sulfidoxydans]QTP56552.1 AMP-binding protein [Halomonas sulfidoxydans]
MTKQAVWTPDRETRQRTRLQQWIGELELNDYDRLLERSVEDTAWFWGAVEKKLGVEWRSSYAAVIEDPQEIMHPRWFTEGRLNIIDSLLERWAREPETGARQALVSQAEDGRQVRYSYGELAGEVARCAEALRGLGVKRGDVVSLYLPMIPQAIIAMLAVIRLGAIYAPSFSGYNAEALAVRLADSGSRFLITADGYYRRGRFIEMKAKADEAIAAGSAVETVVVVNNAGSDPSRLAAHEHDWEALMAAVPAREERELPCEMASDDPLLLIYTSGTSGKPKGAVHTHAGLPLKAALDLGLCMDLGEGDALFWITDMGWLTAPVAVFGAFMNGATLAIYDGAPNHPQEDRLWTLVEAFGATHVGISPTFTRSLMKSDIAPKQLGERVRLFLSTGEPWDDESWHWLFETVGERRIPIINYAGGTEIGGGILVNVLLRPIGPSCFNSPVPGMAAGVVNPDGERVVDELGELVIDRPWVGMTRSFWHDDAKYEGEYFSRWPGRWVHGDMAIAYPDGQLEIRGRSDDTMNVAGKRVGPAEIESIVVSSPAVAEVAVVGVADPLKGEVPLCFVVLKPEAEREGVASTLKALVAERLGKAFAPREVFVVDELPKTKNGKLLRRVVKNAYLGNDVGDLSALESYSAVESIARLGSRGDASTKTP